MPFNANTYHANRARREAWDYLAKARELKARAAVGEAYEWELPRISVFAKLARLSMHSHLNWRAIAKLDRDR